MNREKANLAASVVAPIVTNCHAKVKGVGSAPACAALRTRCRNPRRFAPSAAHLVADADNAEVRFVRFFDNFHIVLRFDARDLSLEIQFANPSCCPRSRSIDPNPL